MYILYVLELNNIITGDFETQAWKMAVRRVSDRSIIALKGDDILIFWQGRWFWWYKNKGPHLNWTRSCAKKTNGFRKS